METTREKSKSTRYNTLFQAQTFKINTPLGNMIGLANNDYLYFLAFEDQKNCPSLDTKKDLLSEQSNPIINSLKIELQKYFDGTLKTFKTPLFFSGTPFQQIVWKTLLTITYGETCSYKELAHLIGNPYAYRAVAQANSANPFSLIVPCHRIITSNGNLGGYNGGLNRKEWLINHEKKNSLI